MPNLIVCTSGQHRYDAHAYTEGCPHCAGVPRRPTTRPPANAMDRAAGEGDGKTIMVWPKEARAHDPPVGWLVVISPGPARGADYRLVAGANSIGRGTDNHVVLDHDPAISTTEQASILYEPMSARFELREGRGRNVTTLVRCGPVLEPVRLQPFDQIRLGRTTVVFAPLCGDHFTWTSHARTGGGVGARVAPPAPTPPPIGGRIHFDPKPRPLLAARVDRTLAIAEPERVRAPVGLPVGWLVGTGLRQFGVVHRLVQGPNTVLETNVNYERGAFREGGRSLVPFEHLDLAGESFVLVPLCGSGFDW